MRGFGAAASPSAGALAACLRLHRSIDAATAFDEDIVELGEVVTPAIPKQAPVSDDEDDDAKPKDDGDEDASETEKAFVPLLIVSALSVVRGREERERERE